MSTIVGVHGIAQQQFGRHLLQAPWVQALADGMERASGTRVEQPDLDIAFYGDLFPDVKPDGAKGIGDAGLDGLDEADVELVVAAAGQVLTNADLASADAGPSKGFPGIPSAVLRVVAAIDRRFGADAGPLFVGELRQARRYLTDAALKHQVDERVAAATAGCRVLIGHSLGSVVALEYLRGHPDHELAMVLTMGSPLALRAIRHLLPEPGFGTEPTGPPNVAQWRNLRDPRDPVALAGGLGADWPVVVDDNTINNGRKAHAATRYLAKRQAGAAVVDTDPRIVAP